MWPKDESLAENLGSRHAVLGLSLAFLGGTALLLSALMTLIGIKLREDELFLLAVPGWALVALPLGLSMRKRQPSRKTELFGHFWLAIVFVVWIIYLLGGF